MEFKLRLNQKKKRAAAKSKKEQGFKRIKVRGRKRWVKASAK